MDDADVFGDISRMHQKQVTIHAGDEGLAETGRVLYVEPDWTTDDLLQAAGRRLDLVSTPKRMFNCNGERSTANALIHSLHIQVIICRTATNCIVSEEGCGPCRRDHYICRARKVDMRGLLFFLAHRSCVRNRDGCM